MDRIRLATGITVIFSDRRVAMAIRFNLWPVRVGVAPPQSLQSCSRVAVVIHCSFAVSSIFRVQRQGSGDPTPCGGYPGPPCSGSFFFIQKVNLLFPLFGP